MAASSHSVSKSKVWIMTGACLAMGLAGCTATEVLIKLGLKKTDPVSEPATEVAQESQSEKARRVRANAEFLKEMHEVVFIRVPKDRSEFGTYVDLLNQGASMEGVYNGFVHSPGYRKLEETDGPVSVETLKAFTDLLVEIEQALPVPTQFDPSFAKAPQILSPDQLAEPAPSSDPSRAVAAGPDQLEKDPARLAESYQELFKSASFFTLKRVLGTEALKLVQAKKKNPDDLSAWYSKWVVRQASRGVDFGIALRNKADEAFHRQWVRNVSEDRLNWEILNRIHRVLNHAAGRKLPQVTAQPSPVVASPGTSAPGEAARKPASVSPTDVAEAQTPGGLQTSNPVTDTESPPAEIEFPGKKNPGTR